MNPMQQAMQLIRQAIQSGNPQQYAVNLVNQAPANNPMANNLRSLANSGDAQGIMNVGNNFFGGQGMNMMQQVSAAAQQFGIKL